MNWKPVRRGNIYCSPSCGADCTWADYHASVKLGEKVLKKLKTKGWQVRIHENMGWFVSWTNTLSGISLHTGYSQKHRNRFDCMFSWNEKSTTSGSYLTRECPSFRDPNDAVDWMVKEVNRVVGWCQKAAGNLAKIKQ